MRQLKVILIFLLPLLHTLIIFLSESKVNYSSQFHCCSLWEDLYLLSLNTDTDFRLITLPILYLHCNPLSANARENYPNDRSHQYHPSLKKKKIFHATPLLSGLQCPQNPQHFIKACQNQILLHFPFHPQSFPSVI